MFISKNDYNLLKYRIQDLENEIKYFRIKIDGIEQRSFKVDSKLDDTVNRHEMEIHNVFNVLYEAELIDFMPEAEQPDFKWRWGSEMKILKKRKAVKNGK